MNSKKSVLCDSNGFLITFSLFINKYQGFRLLFLNYKNIIILSLAGEQESSKICLYKNKFVPLNENFITFSSVAIIFVFPGAMNDLSWFLKYHVLFRK